MRAVPAAVLAVSGLVAGGPAASDWGGFAAFELEYLGENYEQELDLPLSDLSDADAVETSVTRFVDDVWLGGQRLDLYWRSGPDVPWQLDLAGNTFHNGERFGQDVRARGVRRAAGGLWTLDAGGHYREEKRSFLGDGDWNAALLGSYRRAFSSTWSGEIEAGWERSRTLGDTATFVYDYDVGRVRLALDAGSGWLPGWEASLEGRRKTVPQGLAGSYTELVAGGTRRTRSSRGWVFGLEGRARNYDVNGDVGSDFLEADADATGRPLGRGAHALLLETEAVAIDFAEEDVLYYDYARLTVFPSWEWKGRTWSSRLGPQARLLWDTGAGHRDYRQWTARGEIGRGLGPGYVQLAVEAGARDYRAEDAETVSVDALSVSFLRSDYRLLDVLLVGDVPLPGGLSLRVLADSTLEFHDGGERIRISFANVAFAYAF